MDVDGGVGVYVGERECVVRRVSECGSVCSEVLSFCLSTYYRVDTQLLDELSYSKSTDLVLIAECLLFFKKTVMLLCGKAR